MRFLINIMMPKCFSRSNDICKALAQFLVYWWGFINIMDLLITTKVLLCSPFCLNPFTVNTHGRCLIHKYLCMNNLMKSQKPGKLALLPKFLFPIEDVTKILITAFRTFRFQLADISDPKYGHTLHDSQTAGECVVTFASAMTLLSPSSRFFSMSYSSLVSLSPDFLKSQSVN